MTVTDWETMETLIDMGAGLRDESVSSIVCTQLGDEGLAVIKRKFLGGQYIPCTVKIGDKEGGNDVAARIHGGMKRVDEVGGHKPAGFK